MPRSLGTRGAGNFNLKGKKTLGCKCGCCVVQDFREDYAAGQARKEMARGSDEDLEEFDFEFSNSPPRDWAGDTGTWKVAEADGRRIGLISSDFRFDGLLIVTGCFESDAQRRNYAEAIAERLNLTKYMGTYDDDPC